MSTGTNELQDIQASLERLQARVRELAPTAEAEASGAQPAAATPSLAATEPSAAAGPAGAPTGMTTGAAGAAATWAPALQAGLEELSTLTRLKEFPEFFVRLARQSGLRLLLLKRWSSGLQVFLEENVKLPPEARRKRRDGRAPIPTVKDDVFAAVAHDATVYCGPVPQKHFPLDLTLLLGRGARDRQIVILPLPVQGHWNTFLYLDADRPGEPALAVAGALAHFALARMCLLERGMPVRTGQVSAVLNAELDRRRRARDRHEPERREPEMAVLARPRAPEIDPFTATPDSAEADAGPRPVEPVARPLAPAGARRPAPPGDDLEIFADEPAGGAAAAGAAPAALPPATPSAAPSSVVSDTLRHAMTPEIILRHSGELPALPRAACHIMAVIEDPRTTATRLEKALAMDQALTAKVLRIANSPFYGAARQITTVSESIVRLGFVTIRNWTLVTAARSVFLAPGAGMLYQKIWRQSVLSAMGSQLVAQAVGRVQPESVFVGGLMQNIGQLVLARSHPELFQEILAESVEKGQPYHEVETRVLGFDHGELGAMLLREWNLTEELEDAVRWHHRFEHPDARNARIAAMIALGEEIASCQSGDDAPTTDGEQPLLTAPLPAARFLGVSPEQVAALAKRAAALQIDPHFFN